MDHLEQETIPVSIEEPVSIETQKSEDGLRSTTGNIPNKVYFRIGDVAEIVDVKPYVLRYWETEFAMIHPTKSSSGQRVYRRADVETLLLIKHLLYTQRYSIEGARKKVRDLRKSGELDAFKKEIFTGPEAKQQRDLRLKEIKALSDQLHQAVHRPLNQLFRL